MNILNSLLIAACIIGIIDMLTTIADALKWVITAFKRR